MTTVIYMNAFDRPQSLSKAQPTIEVPIILSESPSMRVLLDTLRKAARSSMTVLINGETGTARNRLHAHSIARVRALANRLLPSIWQLLME